MALMHSDEELIHLLELKADVDQNLNLNHKRKPKQNKTKDNMYRDNN